MLRQGKNLWWCLVFVGSALGFFAATVSFTWPLGEDQGIFVWVARVILNGGRPYHDAWDLKGPLSYYMYSFALLLFRDNVLAARAFDLCLVVGSVWLLRKLTLKLNGGEPLGANCAATFFLLEYYGGGFWDTAQPDGWGGMLALLAVFLLIRSRYVHLAAAVVGVIVALATLIKPSFLALLSLPILYGMTDPFKELRVKSIVFCICAFCITIFVLLPSLLGVEALQDFVDVLQFILFGYAAQKRHLLNELVAFRSMLSFLGLLVPCLIAPVGIFRMFRMGLGREAILIAVWTAVSISCLIVQGRYWVYQWIPFAISLSPTIGVAFSGFYKAWLASPGRMRVLSALGVFVCICALEPVGQRAFIQSSTWPVYALGLTDRTHYIADLVAVPWHYEYLTFEKMANYIVNNSEADDKLQMWGLDALPNVLSGHRSPTRFGVVTPLIMRSPLQDKYRRLFMSEIEESPPVYIIVDTTEWDLVQRRGIDLLVDFPEFLQFLRARYIVEKEFGPFRLMHLQR